MPIGNLRGLANGVTRAVNPNLSATLYVSTGFTVDATHKQVPTYTKSSIVNVNIQPESSGDIKQLDALNVQGVKKIAFVNGTVEAIDRIQQAGGDLLVFATGAVPEGTTWLVAISMEQWASTWCKVALVLQEDQLSL